MIYALRLRIQAKGWAVISVEDKHPKNTEIRGTKHRRVLADFYGPDAEENAAACFAALKEKYGL